MLSFFPNITQLVRGEVRIQSKFCLTSKLMVWIGLPTTHAYIPLCHPSAEWVIPSSVRVQPFSHSTLMPFICLGSLHICLPCSSVSSLRQWPRVFITQPQDLKVRLALTRCAVNIWCSEGYKQGHIKYLHPEELIIYSGRLNTLTWNKIAKEELCSVPKWMQSSREGVSVSV